MSNLEGGTWTAVLVSSYRIGSVRLSSSLCGWKGVVCLDGRMVACLDGRMVVCFLLSLFQKKGASSIQWGRVW